ncbi:MAG: YitT family protein [Oscillospiraceae bacterium]|nr:YitT family protein [Oscillospiraceae bacterium]
MLNWLKKLLAIVFSIALISAGINLFLGPHNIAAGGLTGLAIILEELFKLDRSMIILIGNGIVIVATLIFLGREVFLKTAIGASLLPLGVWLVPHYMVIEDVMLSTMIGSVIFAVAVSILYKNNASSGGTIVIPLILKKYFGLNTSVGLFIADGIVVTLCLLVFSIEAFFYAVFSIFLTSWVMHYIETGMKKKKIVYIISDKHEEITNDILHDIGRGVTILPAVGAYNKTPVQVLMITLHHSDYRQLQAVVDKYDKEAFMITNTVTDVHGEGFTYEPGSV